MMEMDAPSDQSLSSKKSQVGETVSIPVDLVIDILKRLPARDVLRSRSVCKEWNFLLRTPKFISLHYNYSLQMRHENAAASSSFVYLRTVPSRPSFRTRPLIPRESMTLTFLTLEKTTTQLVAKVHKEEDFIAMFSSLLFPSCPTQSDLYNLQMICPFDGLICFGCGVHVIMYNPATRESHVLPSDPEFSKYVDMSMRHTLGVWFESTTKLQYKVFRLVTGREWFKIKIYDSTLNSWRASETIFGGDVMVVGSALLLNDVFHFPMIKDSGSVIGTFDARLETFGHFEFPSSFGKVCFVTLLPFHGNLSCMNSSIEMDDYSININVWVMTEYGVEQSWTHKTFGPFDFPGYGTDNDENFGSPLALWDEEDELLIMAHYHTLSFNLNTMEKTNLKLPLIIHRKTHIIPYNVEILLSLK